MLRDLFSLFPACAGVILSPADSRKVFFSPHVRG